MTREHFFVTGALGCIGTWVVQNLLNDGAAVTVFDLAKDVRRWRLLMDDATIARVNLVQGDITQTETVLNAVEKAGDLLDEKTGGQFSDKVDMAQEKAKEIADGLDQAN